MKATCLAVLVTLTCRGVVLRRSVVVAATSSSSTTTASPSPSVRPSRSSFEAAVTASIDDSSQMKEQRRRYYYSSTTTTTPPTKLVQLQIVHRHGDRTPITPLRDAEFWQSQLIPQATLERIAQHTVVERDPDAPQNNHGAIGRGPFGQLTKLGLLQMVQVGASIREQYSSCDDDDDEEEEEEEDNRNVLWTSKSRPLHPYTIQVYSTDFARTIQSVQGLLVGLFPEMGPESSSKKVQIDVRHTSIMIPDPQPRQTQEQAELEQLLARDVTVRQREQDNLSLALRTSQLLQPLLGQNAHEVSFGVDQEQPGDEEIEIQPLAWNQLAEICKCLSVYNQLPDGISGHDVDTILHYAAQRWFHNLQHPRLCYLAMNALVSKQLEHFCRQDDSDAPMAVVWSAHDSTLIGLLCAYRLVQPTKDEWPDYASYLIMEKRLDEHGEAYVRFAMNGRYLRCAWNEDEEPMDMIPLETLVHKIKTTIGELSTMSGSINQ